LAKSGGRMVTAFLWGKEFTASGGFFLGWEKKGKQKEGRIYKARNEKPKAVFFLWFFENNIQSFLRGDGPKMLQGGGGSRFGQWVKPGAAEKSPQGGPLLKKNPKSLFGEPENIRTGKQVGKEGSALNTKKTPTFTRGPLRGGTSTTTNKTNLQFGGRPEGSKPHSVGTGEPRLGVVVFQKKKKI